LASILILWGFVMKRPGPSILSALIFVCLVCPSAFAWTFNTFRCPNGSIVAVNDKLATVMARCDAPTTATTRHVARAPVGYVDTMWGAASYAGRYEIIEIEEWTYNQGPTSFMMFLTFRNGTLTTIESGEYGY
jgi:hypothetical protein